MGRIFWDQLEGLMHIELRKYEGTIDKSVMDDNCILIFDIKGGKIVALEIILGREANEELRGVVEK